MNPKTIQTLIKLKENPSIEKVVHLLLLAELYHAYSNGEKKLQSIINFYLGNGFDNLPTVAEKALWNTVKFEEARRPFIETHTILVKRIDEILNNFIIKEQSK